jgi:hypothetical protein
LPDIDALQNALQNVIQKPSSILAYFYNFYKYWQNSFFLGSVSGRVYCILNLAKSLTANSNEGNNAEDQNSQRSKKAIQAHGQGQNKKV